MPPVRATRASLAYGTILVCGGGCYGGYYVRQLARAVASGALTCHRVLVLDRDGHAPVTRLVTALADGDLTSARTLLWRAPLAVPIAPGAAPGPTAAVAAPVIARDDEERVTRERLDADLAAVRALPLAVEIAPWSTSVPAWLDRAAADPVGHARDALVPSPLMPHLTADWLATRLSAARGGVPVTRVPLPVPPDTPWERAADDGSAHYASFATWICPINCVEPATCPHTRGPRDWSMPRVADVVALASRETSRPIDLVATFHTTHRSHGVGMFDLAAATTAAAAIDALPRDRDVRVLVASVSHCHGAFALLHAAR